MRSARAHSSARWLGAHLSPLFSGGHSLTHLPMAPAGAHESSALPVVSMAVSEVALPSDPWMWHPTEAAAHDSRKHTQGPPAFMGCFQIKAAEAEGKDGVSWKQPHL